MGAVDLGLGVAGRAASGGALLDFARASFRVDGGWSADPTAVGRVGFARSTAAWLATPEGLEAFGPDAPRWDADGILIEGPATNLLRHSADLTAGSWTPAVNGDGVTPVRGVSPVPGPDGVAGATRLTLDRGPVDEGGHLSMVFHEPFTVMAGATHTASFWARAETSGTILMRHVGAAAYAAFEVDGVWRRFSSASVAASGTASLEIGLRGGFGASRSLAVDVWNVQCEAGAASSDVVTGAASATRGADQLTLTGGSGARGTVRIDWAAEAHRPGRRTLASSGGAAVLELVDGVPTATIGGVSLVAGGAAASGTTVRTAVAWEPGRIALAVDGVVVTVAATAPEIGDLEIGARGGADPLNGRALRIERLDWAASDAALAAVTS
ncbi:phage head spike fiber domain-containing protein [Brevundimonas sp.]|jgi:hypothetical protein|uniref:phage head spike fiber domain-containing protein n=1 Tax=Brevundimonas sp. TaxID=1871086 RepID=UPI002E0DC06E|nr:hypothetical protein [Brevundimonas sp.]